MTHSPASIARTRALAELRNHPALPALIPRMTPRMLTRLFAAVGLNDSGALMALTPPPLLAAALDDAVWSSDRTGTRFDPDALVDWLEVWLTEGELFTATRLAALNEGLLAAAFGELIRVHDVDVLGFEHDPEDHDCHAGSGECAERFERFLVAGVRDDEWHVVGPALLALWTHEPARLLALLERLGANHSRPDGEDWWRRLQADAAGDREARRERGGFVNAAAAHAFLETALVVMPEDLASMTGYDLETRRHLAMLRSIEQGVRSAETGDDAPESATGDANADTDAAAESVATAAAVESIEVNADDPRVWALLVESGVLEATRPLALPTRPKSDDLPLRARLRALSEDQVASAATELAYLANVLIADSAFAAELRGESDARDLALALANLGIELLEDSGLDVEIGREPGLVRPFLVARRALHDLPAQIVAAFEAGAQSPAFAAAMARRPWLADDIEGAFATLGASISESRFEHARDAVLLLSLVFDRAACHAVLPLLATVPGFPCVVEGGGADATRWIRGRDDLVRISDLLQALARPHAVGSKHHDRELPPR